MLLHAFNFSYCHCVCVLSLLRSSCGSRSFLQFFVDCFQTIVMYVYIIGPIVVSLCKMLRKLA